MIKKIIVFLTATMFALYLEYHIFLAVQLSGKGNAINMVIRFIGIIVFLLISVASFFMLIPHPLFLLMHRLLMLTGLTVNFIVKLLSVVILLKGLNFSSVPSVLNIAVFALSQIALFLLLQFFVILPRSLEKKSFKSFTVITMSNVIALYSLCLLMECVIVLKYHANIELNILLTLISRLLYYLGFIGLSGYFLLASKEWELPKAEETAEGNDLVFSEVQYED